MRVNETIFNIELSEKELNTIFKSIQAAYWDTREEYINLSSEDISGNDDKIREINVLYNRKMDLLHIGQEISSLIGRPFKESV